MRELFLFTIKILIDNYLPASNVFNSSGNGNLAGSVSVPYSRSSIAFNFVSSTLVESIVTLAVGLNPATFTGVVVTSHEKVIASGLSFIV